MAYILYPLHTNSIKVINVSVKKATSVPHELSGGRTKNKASGRLCLVRVNAQSLSVLRCSDTVGWVTGKASDP